MIESIKEKTIALIDSLKSTCQTYGMGNDGNEYKIITQVFLLAMPSKKWMKILPMPKNGKRHIPTFRMMKGLTF